MIEDPKPGSLFFVEKDGPLLFLERRYSGDFAKTTMTLCRGDVGIVVSCLERDKIVDKMHVLTSSGHLGWVFNTTYITGC